MGHWEEVTLIKQAFHWHGSFCFMSQMTKTLGMQE
jgi:hypothetical protein